MRVKVPCNYKTLKLEAKSRSLSRALEIGFILYNGQNINMNQVNKETDVATARTTELPKDLVLWRDNTVSHIPSTDRVAPCN